eukprot:1159506-Pelagomonas_calceolata.AAC.14
MAAKKVLFPGVLQVGARVKKSESEKESLKPQRSIGFFQVPSSHLRRAVEAMNAMKMMRMVRKEGSMTKP